MAHETHVSPPPLRRIRASVTLVTLCLMTALGIALGSYLALCSRSAQFGARSVSIDQAQQLAQTGLEEALWALNQNSWAGSGPEGSTAWTTSGANRTATLSYTLPTPNGTGQVVLTIANYASTGPTWPSITAAATVTLPSGQAFSKTLQATTGPAPLFANAIASSESYVSFADSGTVDSWNSNPDNDSSTAMVPYSFTTGTASNYTAVVAGRTNGTYGVVLTKATVYGYVATFGLPVTYSTSGSPAPKVLGPTTAAAVNIDSARIGKSAFVPDSSVFTVAPPTSFSNGGLFGDLLALVNSLNLVTLGSTASFKRTGDYVVSGGLLGAANLTINGNVKFVIDGDFKIVDGLLGAKGKITINPGASLEIFVTGDITIDADGFDNKTNEPKNLAIYCTATGSSPAITYTSGRSFCGVIYSENRPIDIQENGPFYGALLSRGYVRFSGGATNPIFHYDSALRNVKFPGITTPYILKRITEL